MLEVFTTNKYNTDIAVINGDKTYTFFDLKQLIAAEIEFLKNKKENVVILGGNNFDFIIQFFGALFSGKNIFLLTDKTRLKDLNVDYDILEGILPPQNIDNYVFPDIDTQKGNINFFTSGSSGTPKIIKKSIYNLICEGQDAGIELGLKGKNLTVVSTTTMCHLFGLTFHLMFPLCNGLIIDTKNISYPENIDKTHTMLVSTPTFLSSIPKFEIPFKVPPEYIFTAGSKLDEKVFEELEKTSNIVEIYGSTETGIIARKTHFCDEFELFDNVSIKVNKDNIEIRSNYFFEDEISINDNIELNNRKLKIKARTDRLFKIYEKRISADELENKLKKNNLVDNCYILKHKDKLACLCALSEEGKTFLLKNNIYALTKNLKQYISQSSEIIPQKWKFIDEIPMTTTGKINKKLIEHIFNMKLSLPVILSRSTDNSGITYKIFIYNQCNFFKGHFPEFKLVPGVFQIYFAKELANSHFGLSLGEGQWKRIKFSNIIEPDSIVNLKLEKKDNHVIYEIFSNTKKYASGVFLCENIFKGAVG